MTALMERDVLVEIMFVGQTHKMPVPPHVPSVGVSPNDWSEDIPAIHDLRSDLVTEATEAHFDSKKSS